MREMRDRRERREGKGEDGEQGEKDAEGKEREGGEEGEVGDEKGQERRKGTETWSECVRERETRSRVAEKQTWSGSFRWPPDQQGPRELRPGRRAPAAPPPWPERGPQRAGRRQGECPDPRARSLVSVRAAGGISVTPA